MAPVPFPFNVLGDYNGARPPRYPDHQQAPTKHAHRNHRGPRVDHLGRETRYSAPTMKTSQAEPKPANGHQSEQATPLHQQWQRRRWSKSQRKPARVGKAPSAPTMESAAGRGRTASAVQNVQVGMKKARHRPFGHALPFSCQLVVLDGAQRRVVPAFGKTPEHKSAPSRARNRRGLKVGVYRWVYPTGQTMTR